MSHANPHVAHQFENATQQRQAASLGMWVFLATEVMFFSGLFFAYALFLSNYPEAFRLASSKLDIALGATNTMVLILSSFTMAMAVWAVADRPPETADLLPVRPRWRSGSCFWASSRWSITASSTTT